MMPGNVFCLELAAAFADRRRIALRVGLSLLLAIPFVLIRMPARAQTAGIAMVILFTGLFGAAVSHAHLREDGRFDRLVLLPKSRSILWLDLALAATLSRLVPVAIVLIAFVVVNGSGTTAATLLVLAGLLCASLLLLALLGIGAARLAHSNAEVHLFGALVAALTAFLSGLTPLPGRLAWLADAARWNPLSQLHATLVALATGPVSISANRLAFACLALVGITIAALLRAGQGTGLFERWFDTKPSGPHNDAGLKGGQG